MNGSGCLPLHVLGNGSVEDYKWTLISTGIIVAVSVVVCLVAMVLILAMKLHAKLVYRLTLYEIITIILVLIVWEVYLSLRFGFPVVIKYPVEVVLNFSLSVYYLLSTWIVIHLFALAICLKNFNRLEPLYVVSSFLISLVIAAVSLALVFTASSEKNSPHCIALRIFYAFNILVAVLACLLIALNFVLGTIIGLVLCNRAYCKKSGRRSLYNKQHKKTLCAMLPLVINPLFSISVPGYVVALNHFDFILDYRSRFIVPIITLGACLCFSIPTIIHLSMIILITRRKVSRFANIEEAQ